MLLGKGPGRPWWNEMTNKEQQEMEERILDFMKEKAMRPMTDEAIINGMALATGGELDAFWPSLKSLEEQAKLIKNRNGLYGIPRRMSLVVGKISVSAKGFAFITPDDKESDDEKDVFVPGTMLSSAMNGDIVVARVTPPVDPTRSPEGEIIRIVKRANERIVGTFEASKSFGFVTPDDTKLSQDIFIPQKAVHGASTGMKVVVKITKWPEGGRSAEGKVVELLGMSGDPGVDVLSVMRQYDLSESFPEDVQREADAIEDTPSPEEYEGRRDRRDLHIVTVDGDDSKDLDDGVYCEKRPDGTFFLGVYIADVSWYVRENHPLDREARERGTSVYLVDRVIPMLPKKLSNGICSLNAGTDRLAMACEMEIGTDGVVKRYEIVPAVVHVYRRLTYNIVNKILEGSDPDIVRDNEDIRPMLEDLRDLRNAMKDMRHRRGAIDFDLSEVKVKLDDKGHPVALIKREGTLAESIIEQCMLAANETVAEHMDKKQLPFIYRVHEQPSDEKTERLNSLLAAFGLHIHQNEGGQIKPSDVQQVLEKVKGRPEERIISAVALRSMMQAHYEDRSLGHFGLAARYYTHFTSPIRRYPDLIVPRLLRATFRTGTMSQERQDHLKEILPEIAEHTSSRERVAIDAERDTTEMKEIEYMVQFEGDIFRGVISGVTSFGIFVELDNGVEGLVHVSSMVDDYYEYAEEQYALVGETSGKRYRLGDEVEVQLVRADVEERNIDFILNGNGVYSPAPSKTSNGRGNGTKRSDGRQGRKGTSGPRGNGKQQRSRGKGHYEFKDSRNDDNPFSVLKNLNKAVWPDPKQNERPKKEEKAPRARKDSGRPRHHLKTEGGTKNSD